MRVAFIVGLGGLLGTLLRFWVGEWFARSATAFPWGTLLVNITGSFVFGLIVGGLPGLEQKNAVGVPIREFLLIGVLGGFTTFSSFSWQTLDLVHQDQWLMASWNVAASLAGCLGAAALGHWTGRIVHSFLTASG
jgi:fluoride exporter